MMMVAVASKVTEEVEMMTVMGVVVRAVTVVRAVAVALWS